MSEIVERETAVDKFVRGFGLQGGGSAQDGDKRCPYMKNYEESLSKIKIAGPWEFFITSVLLSLFPIMKNKVPHLIKKC